MAEAQAQQPSSSSSHLLVVSDATLSPRTFAGTADESAADWFTYFNRFASYRKVNDLSKCEYFAILMRSSAADWFDTLPETTKTTFADLDAAFRHKFCNVDMMRWQNADKLWSRSQRDDETVDQYVTAVTKLAKAVPVNDEALIRYSIIRGLKPNIRLHVTQQEINTTDQLLRAARIAEMAQPLQTSASSDPVLSEI